MKKRVKIDSSILSFVIIFTGVLCLFDNLYLRSKVVDNALDCLGLIVVIKGILLRMSARGHKKAHSQKSESLVTTGPYTIVRNPMYLGSFLIGAGFVLIVWPWWCIFIFAALFYLRFVRQIIKEEEFLVKEFGKDFENFSKSTPRVFPTLKSLSKVKTSEVFNTQDAFSTKEKWGLLGWPVLALVLESFQELLVFGLTDIYQTIIIFIATIIIFIIGFTYSYHKH